MIGASVAALPSLQRLFDGQAAKPIASQHSRLQLRQSSEKHRRSLFLKYILNPLSRFSFLVLPDWQRSFESFNFPVLSLVLITKCALIPLKPT